MQVERMYKVLRPYSEHRIDELTENEPVLFIDPPKEDDTQDCYDHMVIQ